MDINDLQQHWNSFAKNNAMWAILTSTDSWNEEAFFETGVQEINALMNYIESLSIQVSRHTALDFGCGVGRLSQALANYFENVKGVDIAPAMIEQAKQFNRHGERCDYFLNDQDNLRIFPTDTFDFIYSNITLQHIAPNYTQNYLRDFIRVLKPGGVLVFQLPSDLIIHNPIKRQIISIAPKIVMKQYHNLKYRIADPTQSQPRMEMHGIKKADVIKLIESQNARMVDIIQDQRETADHHWKSYQYCVMKPITGSST